MRLLIVDDDAGLRQSLALLLQEAGYDVASEGDPEQALRRAAVEAFDLILSDVRMPKMDGVTFLRRYRADGGQALLIMMSAYGSEDSALAAMREGAYDYLHKPFRPDEVTHDAAEGRGAREAPPRGRGPAHQPGAGAAGDLVVSESRAMRDLLELASRVARHSTTVLITGESGTGKEVLARAIHRMSPRERAELHRDQLRRDPRAAARERAVRPRAGRVHRRHAPTAPACSRWPTSGTLLLDEIGDLPLDLQAKLLRVLRRARSAGSAAREPQQVDVRVIAATAKPLEAAVERGEFRADLFYRLNVVAPPHAAAPRAAGGRAARCSPTSCARPPPGWATR